MVMLCQWNGKIAETGGNTLRASTASILIDLAFSVFQLYVYMRLIRSIVMETDIFERQRRPNRLKCSQ